MLTHRPVTSLGAKVNIDNYRVKQFLYRTRGTDYRVFLFAPNWGTNVSTIIFKDILVNGTLFMWTVKCLINLLLFTGQLALYWHIKFISSNKLKKNQPGARRYSPFSYKIEYSKQKENPSFFFNFFRTKLVSLKKNLKKNLFFTFFALWVKILEELD